MFPAMRLDPSFPGPAVFPEWLFCAPLYSSGQGGPATSSQTLAVPAGGNGNRIKSINKF